MTTTSMRTIAELEALDQPPQGPITAGAGYPAGADTQMSAAGTQLAAAGYMAPLGYSEVPDDDALGAELGYDELSDQLDSGEPETARKLFLLVGSALASILAVGTVALVISLAVGIRPTGDQLPSSGEAAIVPNSQASVPAAPEVQQPPPIPSGVDTIQEPVPVVQQAPRTVYVTPAQQAPLAVMTPPAAPAPAPPAEDPKPPMDPRPAPENPVPAPVPPSEDPEPPMDLGPAPEDAAPAPVRPPGNPAPAPQPHDLGRFPVPPRAPEDPRPPVALPPIIPAPTPPFLPSSE